ncbi:hypothetical protein KVT40_007616 [Elsinoe batatas]|uniref:Zn(2)-C6 fungal-type domain-containing protein n=1 Tax=Elsinoe batatas TaxID=2601811 RepID=A0A8K0KXE5_9PEZI|nr:hypothetical protein KVT40_007616 [Elsinoe batatas]
MYDQHSSHRRLKPKRDSADQGSSAVLEKPSRKRVTASACVACRKRKSKCDSTKPACSACTSVYNTECSYDTESEPARKASSRRPSARPDPFPSTISGLREIICGLQAQPDADTILLNQLRNVQTRLESLSAGSSTSELPPTPTASVASFAPSSYHDTPPTQYLNVPQHGQDTASFAFDSSQPCGSWFEKPIPHKLVSELFSHYVLYHHPYFPIFSVQHFLGDFRSGDTQFCSSILIYAILSMACNYWKGKIQGDHDKPARAHEFGETFAHTVQKKLFNTREASLTTIQAISILGMRQGSTGDLNGAYHWHGVALRMALSMNMHLEADAQDVEIDPIEQEVRKLTFWGVYNLEMALAIFAGKVSQISNGSIGIPKPTYSEKRDSIIVPPLKGRTYSDAELNREIHYLRYVSHFCELSKLVNEVNLSYYAPQNQINISDVYYALQRYHSWEHDLPVEFQNTDLGGAEVSYLHMYYRQVLIQLLRPFLACEPDKLGFSAKTICLDRATEIVRLWRGLKQQYKVWSLHMLVIPPLRDAAHLFLFQLHEPSAAAYLQEIIEDLRSFAFLHPLASCVVSSLHEVAIKYHVDCPKGLFDRYLQDTRNIYVPSLGTSAFTVRAKIDIETPAQHPHYHPQTQGQYQQHPASQEMGQYGVFNLAMHHPTPTYSTATEREYPQYFPDHQMSGDVIQGGYQMMHPFSGQGPGPQQPPRP